MEMNFLVLKKKSPEKATSEVRSLAPFCKAGARSFEYIYALDSGPQKRISNVSRVRISNED